MLDVVVAMGGADCEALRAGWLAQPANAVSSLGYVGAGVVVLWRSRRIVRRRMIIIAAALAMVATGLGSAAYHGPQPGWAAPAHDGAIAWLVLVFVALALMELAGSEGRRAAAGTILTATAWMLPAVAAYAAGRTGSPLCRPSTLWQPHAAWHVLSAAALCSALLGTSDREGRQRTSSTPSMPAGRCPGTEQ